MLIGARKTGDKTLEHLAKKWLAEQGIVVRFATNLRKGDIATEVFRG
jgi:hypothetical protein